ncbi:MAG: T9SS type A sorting domain-containing protein [Candidatus Zixiibacteriota bacterium]
MRYSVLLILILTLLPLASEAEAEQILICDLVSSQSSTGGLLDSIYSEHDYYVERIDHIPPSDSFPEVTIIWAGIPEYGFWHSLTQIEIDRIIETLTSAKYIWAMGELPFSLARLCEWFGYGELTWDPQPLDTLYGVDWNFLAGHTWLYNERPMSTYAITGWDGANPREDWEVLNGGPDNPGSRGCRAVAYADSQYFYKAFVLNIDLSRIIESDTFATVEDFALKVMRDWFELCPVGVQEVQSEVLPANLYLSNYPNPFNATTTVNYQLPVDAHIRLDIYNLLGDKVASLVDERQQAGYRSVIWDASNVSSGLYFYRLTAGDFKETKRMMLVK